MRHQIVLGLLASLGFLCVGRAHAQLVLPDDPHRYGLRTGVFPAAFVAGISQSHFGSGGRAELDLGRRLTLHASGHVGWANVSGQSHGHGYALRVGASINFSDERELSNLAGTVYPEDTPEVGGTSPGSDHELVVGEQAQYGPYAPEHELTTKAYLREVHSLRIGYDLAHAVERARPNAEDDSARYELNTFHAAYLGYGWASHWNLGAVAAGGSPQLGYRRFYLDALFTLKGLATSKPIAGKPGQPPDFFALGGRLGMEGSIDDIVRSARSLGFAYCLELGVLPGRSGIEGYLFVGLGLAFDAPVRALRH